MDTLTAIEKYGLPLVIIALVSLFTKRDIWPFITKQIDQWQADRKVERQQFIDSLKDLTRIAETGHAARAERDRMLNDQMQHMTSAIAELAIILRELKHTPQSVRISHPRNTRHHDN